MTYTHIDHELTPFSDHADILDWLERLRAWRDASPDDEGVKSALEDVERIARLVGLGGRAPSDARGFLGAFHSED